MISIMSKDWYNVTEHSRMSQTFTKIQLTLKNDENDAVKHYGLPGLAFAFYLLYYVV